MFTVLQRNTSEKSIFKYQYKGRNMKEHKHKSKNLVGIECTLPDMSSLKYFTIQILVKYQNTCL